MKILLNIDTKDVAWRGETYPVQAAVPEGYLLLNWVDAALPNYNPATSKLTETPHRMVGDTYANSIDVVPLTAEELEVKTANLAAQADLAAKIAAGNAVFAALPAGKRVLWSSVRDAVADLVTKGQLTDALNILTTTPQIYADMETDRTAMISALTTTQ